jgi:hypothetical protein
MYEWGCEVKAVNYCRNTKTGELRFFGHGVKIGYELLLRPWVWYAMPNGEHDVTLVGETQGERLERMRMAYQ